VRVAALRCLIAADRETMMEDEQVELTTTEARAGTTPHIVRYVLIISLVLVIVALGLVLATAS
jgi:hypothetical protein